MGAPLFLMIPGDIYTLAFEVFVTNLMPTATAERLREFLSQWGEVDNIRLAIHRGTGSLTGSAFVTFFNSRAQHLAIQLADGCQFEGATLHIEASYLPSKKEVRYRRRRREKLRLGEIAS